MDQRPAIEWRIFPIEVTDEGKVHCRLVCAVEEYSHMSLLWGGRPNPPDTTRAFHFGQHQLSAFLADDAIAIAVGIPIDVLAAGRVVAASAVVTGPLRALLAGGWLAGQ